MTQHTETVTVKFTEEEVRKMIWALEFMTKVSSMCQKDFEVNELLIDMNRILEQIKEAKGEKENDSYIQETSCESCEG
jgi:hypothetical protein